jgi:hypothetical protein
VTLPGPTERLKRFQRRWNTAATCTITRPGGVPVFDPDTGQYTDPADVTVYSGNCRVAPIGSEQDVKFGEAPLVLRRYNMTLDGLSEAVHVEDVVTVASTADPQLDGMVLRVLDVKKSSLPSNRRLACEEVLD